MIVMTHSKIPPSSAYIWGSTDGCTGWVEMSQNYPQLGDDLAAREGEASHEIGANLINNFLKKLEPGKACEYVDKQHSNGVVYTDEMFECAEVYANTVINIFKNHKVDAYGIEKRLTMPTIHDESFGTPDAYIISGGNKFIDVFDYKFGHEYVNEYENWQLMDYVSGIIDHYGIAEAVVNIHVVQPRVYGKGGDVRTWITNTQMLRPYINTLFNNAHIALGDNSELNTGPHCKHCSARHVCKPALDAGMSLFEYSGKPIPQVLSNDAKGLQLIILTEAMERLKLLKIGFEESILHDVLSGENIPGWKSQQGYSSDKWLKPVNEIIILGKILGVDFKKPDDVITPTQAYKKAVDPDTLLQYITKFKTKVSITRELDTDGKRYFS